VYNLTNPGAISHNKASSSCSVFVPANNLRGASNDTSLEALSPDYLDANRLVLRTMLISS
jgi:hypothetical protein